MNTWMILGLLLIGGCAFVSLIERGAAELLVPSFHYQYLP